MITELSKEARDERNEYQREWRTNNKEKVKAINHRYWEKKAKENRGEKDD